jgi:hypothetical protein
MKVLQAAPVSLSLIVRPESAESWRVIELLSPLAPDEAAAHLQEAINSDGPLGWLGSKAVSGRVSGTSVRLRKRVRYENPFQTVLRGSLERHGDGSVFRGSAGVAPFVAAFMALWFAGAVVIGGTVFAVFGVLALLGRLTGREMLMGLGIPPLVLVFGALFVSAGRRLAREDEQFLVSFVAQVLDSPRM